MRWRATVAGLSASRNTWQARRQFLKAQRSSPGSLCISNFSTSSPESSFAVPAYVNVIVRDELKTSTSYQVHDRQRCMYQSLRTQSRVGESVLASARSGSQITLQPKVQCNLKGRLEKRCAKPSWEVAQSLAQRNFPACGSSLSFSSPPLLVLPPNRQRGLFIRCPSVLWLQPRRSSACHLPPGQSRSSSPQDNFSREPRKCCSLHQLERALKLCSQP